MLFGRSQTVSRRVAAVLLATLAAAAPAAGWYAGANAGFWDWPKSSGPLGVAFGIVGGLLVFFEMLIAPRKWFRGWRLGATKIWMRWHVWLGLLCLPVIVIHSGFAFGGLLSRVTMILFLIVIASGVYGLVLQQWLPKKLLDDIPPETVASEVDVVGGRLEFEARRAVAGFDVPDLDRFQTAMLVPYLKGGVSSGSPLASTAESGRLFARLRAVVNESIEPAVGEWERLALLRRNWDRQVRINGWLHGWLIVHLPASVAMTGFMIVHAVFALRWV